jgi:hypothetical protein
MSLKQTIKAKICLATIAPNYPLREFVEWAENIDKRVLLHCLEDIQQELEEEQNSLTPGYSASGENIDPLLQRYWCLYCAQVKKYYSAIVRNPSIKSVLSFLLVSSFFLRKPEAIPKKLVKYGPLDA